MNYGDERKSNRNDQIRLISIQGGGPFSAFYGMKLAIKNEPGNQKGREGELSVYIIVKTRIFQSIFRVFLSTRPHGVFNP